MKKQCIECGRVTDRYYANNKATCAFCISERNRLHYHEKMKRILELRKKKK